jgi:MYXO-CTERM domain-containing protein
LVLIGSGHAHADIVYDLAADWSDEINPNGVWSYNKGPGDPLLVHHDAWSPSHLQPVWADAQLPHDGHIPAWAKSVEGGLPAFGADIPVGRVGLHTNDPVSGGSTNANVTWTMPIDGTIVLSGGIWLADHVNDRPQGWRLLDQSRSELCGGHLHKDDQYTSSNPFLFEEIIAVSAGDVITVEVFREDQFGTWVGLDLSVAATPIPEPSTLANLGGLLGMGLVAGWRRRRRKAA